jgi:AcrR family transcriptional regulator
MAAGAGAKRAAPSTEETPDTRGDRSRKAIKRAVAKLAERKDVPKINLSEICRACKLTTGALYFHFKGKEEVIEEMVIDEIAVYYGRVVETAQGLDFDALAAVMIAEITRFHRTRHKLAKAMQVVINTRPRAYEAWIAARRPILAEMERAIGDNRRAADLATADVGYLAVVTLNAMEDLAMDAFQWGNPTLAPYIKSDQEWNDRQRQLWSHAVMAPMA